MFLRPPERSPDRPAAVAIRLASEAQVAGAATLQSVADGLNARRDRNGDAEGAVGAHQRSELARAPRLSPLTAAGRPRARGLHKKARLGLG